MTNKLFFLSLFAFLLFACKSDDDCDLENLPTFEMNVVGTWSYPSGKIQINEDGTYEDIEGLIVDASQTIDTREWRIENGRLIFDIGNASSSLAWLENYVCDSFTLDGEGFIPNITFTRD